MSTTMASNLATIPPLAPVRTNGLSTERIRLTRSNLVRACMRFPPYDSSRGRLQIAKSGIRISKPFSHFDRRRPSTCSTQMQSTSVITKAALVCLFLLITFIYFSFNHISFDYKSCRLVFCHNVYGKCFLQNARNAAATAEQTQTVTRKATTITSIPGKEKSPKLYDGGSGFPPYHGGGGGGGGGGNGDKSSGGWILFALLGILGFLKDKEIEWRNPKDGR